MEVVHAESIHLSPFGQVTSSPNGCVREMFYTVNNIKLCLWLDRAFIHRSSDILRPREGTRKGTVKVNYWISIRGSSSKRTNGDRLRLIVSSTISIRVKQNRNSTLLYALTNCWRMTRLTLSQCFHVSSSHKLIRLCYLFHLHSSLLDQLLLCSAPPSFDLLATLKCCHGSPRMRRNEELDSPQDQSQTHWIKFFSFFSTMMTEIFPIAPIAYSKIYIDPLLMSHQCH